MERIIPSINDISVELAKICKDSSIKKVWLFGSYARNEADPLSDLDLIVDLDDALDIEKLDTILSLDVDSLTLKSFDRKRKSNLRFDRNFVSRVDREKILVYEKERK